MELVTIVPAQCRLGEGPVWDPRSGTLWFTDIQGAQLLRLDWPSGALSRLDLPERLGSLALTTDPDLLLCAFASGFALYRPATGGVYWLFRTEPAYRGVRMNDGRVDRQGRFWAGSMVEREEDAPPERGSLWRLDPAEPERPIALLAGISISNSICFSPDGRHLYFADTPSREIAVYDLSPDGSLSGPRTFARLEEGGYPDGSDIDAEGRVWNAEWGSSRITAYNPDGSVLTRLALPASQPTCVAFGGSELDLLFVTTAQEGLTSDALAREPHAGDLFVYKTDVTGLAAPMFPVSSLKESHDVR